MDEGQIEVTKNNSNNSLEKINITQDGSIVSSFESEVISSQDRAMISLQDREASSQERAIISSQDRAVSSPEQTTISSPDEPSSGPEGCSMSSLEGATSTPTDGSTGAHRVHPHSCTSGESDGIGSESDVSSSTTSPAHRSTFKTHR